MNYMNNANIKTENYGGQIWCEIKPIPYRDGESIFSDYYSIQTSEGAWLALCEVHRIVSPARRRGEIIYNPIKLGSLKEVNLSNYE